MAHKYRVKFNAALAANGDITPGAAITGFKTDALSSGVFTILIERPGTGDWQICTYDTGAASGSRRTMVEESAGSPFATLPATGLVATFVAPIGAYANTDLSSIVVGTASEAQSPGTNNVVVGDGSTVDKSGCILIGSDISVIDYSGDADDTIIIGNGNFAVPTDRVVIGTVNSPHYSHMAIDSGAAAGGAGTYALISPSDPLLLHSGYAASGVATRVKGTIVADIPSDHTYRRVWDVDYTIGAEPSVVYSTFTVLATGGAGTLSLSVSSGGVLSITVGGTYTGIRVVGLLMASKLVTI